MVPFCPELAARRVQHLPAALLRPQLTAAVNLRRDMSFKARPHSEILLC